MYFSAGLPRVLKHPKLKDRCARTVAALVTTERVGGEHTLGLLTLEPCTNKNTLIKLGIERKSTQKGHSPLRGAAAAAAAAAAAPVAIFSSRAPKP